MKITKITLSEYLDLKNGKEIDDVLILFEIGETKILGKFRDDENELYSYFQDCKMGVDFEMVDAVYSVELDDEPIGKHFKHFLPSEGSITIEKCLVCEDGILSDEECIICQGTGLIRVGKSFYDFLNDFLRRIARKYDIKVHFKEPEDVDISSEENSSYSQEYFVKKGFEEKNFNSENLGDINIVIESDLFDQNYVKSIESWFQSEIDKSFDVFSEEFRKMPNQTLVNSIVSNIEELKSKEVFMKCFSDNYMVHS